MTDLEYSRKIFLIGPGGTIVNSDLIKSHITEAGGLFFIIRV